MTQANTKHKKKPEMFSKETKHAKRTRSLINHGFIELMQEKNFNDITVFDVCEKAMITRATFYKYYEDKYHLAFCVLDECNNALFEKAGKKDPQKTSRQIYRDAVRIFIDFVNTNRLKFEKFFKVGCDEKLRAVLLQKISKNTEELFSGDDLKINVNIPADLISHFVIGGFAEILMYIFETNKHFDTEEVVKWVEELAKKFFN